jgi:serine/threonine-protein kinase
VALCREVEALLAEDQRGAPLLDAGLARAAGAVLEGGAAEPLPERIGPYRITGLLGEGGGGVVYRAERADLGRAVAVKVLRDAWLSPARRERFLAEQRMLVQLDHPSIAHLYDAALLPDGTPWFALELVVGHPLTAHCARRRAGLAERLALFRQVCAAVVFAHRHAIVHCDLKPANALVRADGTVKLLDFGIARHLALTATEAADATRTVLRQLTPAYAAPEQLRGAPVGFHTDVWALGVVLYELLAGRRPFDDQGLDPVEHQAAVLEAEPERPSLVARRAARAGEPVPAAGRAAWADLDVLCLAALEKDQARRTPSAEALLRDLDHFLASEPLEARPDALGYRLDRFARRHWRGLVAGGAAALALASSTAWFTVHLARAGDAARAEAARAQHVERFMLGLLEGGENEVGPAADLRVLTLLERGAREADALSSEPRTQAELFATLGTLFQRLGRRDQAEALLTRALAQQRALDGPRGPAVGERLVALGQLREDQARMEEAEQLVREGLELQRAGLRQGHPGAVRAQLALGTLLGDLGRTDEAVAALEEAVRLRSGPGVPPLDLASALGQLADVHASAGHFDEADAHNRRALDLYRAQLGEGHPLFADRLSWLAEGRMQLGHADEAEPLERRALEVFRRWHGPEHPRTALALRDLARSLIALKRLEEADPLLREAFATQLRLFGRNHTVVADSLYALATLTYFRKRYGEAAELCRQSQEVMRAVHGDRHRGYGMALGCESVSLVRFQDWPRAEQVARQARQVLRASLPESHPNVYWTTGHLGIALSHLGRYAEAEPLLRSVYQLTLENSGPGAEPLNEVRAELVALYQGLERPAEAARFLAELQPQAVPPIAAGAAPSPVPPAPGPGR